jgi:hypothetical protein
VAGRDHERSMDEYCCLFCSNDTPVHSDVLFKVHGDVCDRDKYFMNMRFCVLTVVLTVYHSTQLNIPEDLE